VHDRVFYTPQKKFFKRFSQSGANASMMIATRASYISHRFETRPAFESRRLLGSAKTGLSNDKDV
ncbi:MAG: hypothetical protein ACRENG_32185, partial [bacterium]